MNSRPWRLRRWDFSPSFISVIDWRMRKANSRPMTEATCMIRFRFSSRRSMRAAMIPWIVSGISMSEGFLLRR